MREVVAPVSGGGGPTDPAQRVRSAETLHHRSQTVASGPGAATPTPRRRPLPLLPPPPLFLTRETASLPAGVTASPPGASGQIMTAGAPLLIPGPPTSLPFPVPLPSHLPSTPHDAYSILYLAVFHTPAPTPSPDRGRGGFVSDMGVSAGGEGGLVWIPC